MKKLWIVLLYAVVVIAAIVLGVEHYRSQSAIPPATSSIASTTALGCLSGDEYADIPMDEKKETFYGFLLTSSTINVSIKSKKTGDIVSTFSIQNVDYSNIHPLDLGPCGVYVLREFGRNSFPGYGVQLWRYDYMSTGSELFNLFDIASSGAEENYYFPAFSIDPKEKYLVLQKGQGVAIVIDDPRTTENLYTLPIATVLREDPDIAGDIDFTPGGWSSDGRYFWFTFNQDADVVGFVQIDTIHWSYKAFAAPTTTMGGDAFNPDTGMTTYSTNVAPWTADSASDAYYQQQALQSGQITSFSIYDFLTGKNYLVATTTDPTYYFQPQWMSDSVLQYKLPSGATTIYTIPSP